MNISKGNFRFTPLIFETNTIGVENETLNVDDVIEIANHYILSAGFSSFLQHLPALLSAYRQLHLVFTCNHLPQTNPIENHWFRISKSNVTL